MGRGRFKRGSKCSELLPYTLYKKYIKRGEGVSPIPQSPISYGPLKRDIFVITMEETMF